MDDRAFTQFKVQSAALVARLDHVIADYRGLSNLLEGNQALYDFNRQNPMSFSRPDSEAPSEAQALYCLRTLQDRFGNHLQICHRLARLLNVEANKGDSITPSLHIATEELMDAIKHVDQYFARSNVSPYALLDEFAQHVDTMRQEGKASQAEADAVHEWKDRFAESFAGLDSKPRVFSSILSKTEPVQAAGR